MKADLHLSTYYLCLFASFLSGLLGGGGRWGGTGGVGFVVFLLYRAKKGLGTLSHLVSLLICVQILKSYCFALPLLEWGYLFVTW